MSNPGKVFFPEHGGNPAITKLDLIEYYLSVAEPALRQLHDRPGSLKRYVDGINGKVFFQKQIPKSPPEWLQTAQVTFPSGRTAEEFVAQDEAHLAWALNLGVVDFNPWPVCRPQLDHPNELRIDLDPEPNVPWESVKKVALTVNEVLSEHGLQGFAKTSGSRGIHVYASIKPDCEFIAVRRASVALVREVARRQPDLASTSWWKEERHGVFLDYNQNARDRTIASAWSVRPNAQALVSMPLTWASLQAAELEDFNIRTAPALLQALGDPFAELAANPGSLDPLLKLADEVEQVRGFAGSAVAAELSEDAGRAATGTAKQS